MKKSSEHDQALVALGLELHTPSSVHEPGEKPSDEELIALSGDKLPVHRRSQILAHIAQNTETYSRWIQTVEYHREVTAPASAENGKHSAILQKKIGFKSLLAAASGIAATIALTFVLLKPQTFSYNESIALLYNDYHPAIDITAFNSPPTRSVDSRAPLYTPEHLAITLGIHDGLQQLGLNILEYEDHLKFVQSNTAVSLNTLHAKDYDLLFAFGRLTAIAYVSCKTTMEDQFIDNISAAYQKISGQLATVKNHILPVITHLHHISSIENAQKPCISSTMVMDLLQINH